MGSHLSTLLWGQYTMLPIKDDDTEVHESPIDQCTEEAAKDVSAFQNLRRLFTRYLSRETWVGFPFRERNFKRVAGKIQMQVQTAWATELYPIFFTPNTQVGLSCPRPSTSTSGLSLASLSYHTVIIHRTKIQSFLSSECLSNSYM